MIHRARALHRDAAHGLTSIAVEKDQMLRQRSQLEADLRRSEAEVTELATKVSALQAELEFVPEHEAIEVDMIPNPMLGYLRQNLAKLEMERNRLLQLYTPQHRLALDVENEIAALRQYGHDLGIAFQIMDDVLDFIGDASQVGKPVANDLRQGIVTLPVIDYLDAHPRDKRVDELLRNGQHSDEVVLPIVADVRASGAVDRAVTEARDFVRAAQQRLMRFPASEARQSMLAVADYVVARNY